MTAKKRGPIPIYSHPLISVAFNRPTLTIFSVGLGEPILFKILVLAYVSVVNVCLNIRALAVKLTILYHLTFPLFYKKFVTVHKK
jgi:hypothetical protein